MKKENQFLIEARYTRKLLSDSVQNDQEYLH
jgi:hypothetical protein